jgi:hypothetical protein
MRTRPHHASLLDIAAGELTCEPGGPFFFQMMFRPVAIPEPSGFGRILLKSKACCCNAKRAKMPYVCLRNMYLSQPVPRVVILSGRGLVDE